MVQYLKFCQSYQIAAHAKIVHMFHALSCFVVVRYQQIVLKLFKFPSLTLDA